jgi:oligopeptide transport system substrate-binding protein
MAEGVETSSDGLTYTFTLRDGPQWSNGDPVTSQDFKYAWLKVLDPETAATYAYIISTFVKGADAYNTKKGDPGTSPSRRRTTRPARRAQQQVAVLLAAHQLRDVLSAAAGVRREARRQVRPGRGEPPLQRPVHDDRGHRGGGQTVVLEKNDKYWDKDNVAVETINGRIVKENDTAINLYEGGELDLTALEGNKVQQYVDSPDFFRRVEPFTVYGRLNQKAPGLDNINIRKALMIGFDRRA